MERNDRQELVDYLNAWEAARPVRRAHRLPAAYYATDCWCFFWTLCARERGRPFEDRGLAQAVVEALVWRRERHHWKLLCYCLMPDHLHFVVQLPTGEVAMRNT